MGWQHGYVASFLFIAQASCAAVLQQPLQAYAPDLSLDDPATANLRRVVGNRLIDATPVGKPCYSPQSSMCATVFDSKSVDTWTSNQPGGYFYANWASCQADGQTCALPTTNDSSAIPPTNVCYQGSVPSLMINLTSTDTLVEDVEAAFDWTRQSGKPLIIKNTGHDWKGRSAAPGSLALWTHHLQHPAVEIKLDRGFVPDGCLSIEEETVFHFPAGQQWGGAYHFAEQNDLAVLGGTCGTVGIAGWLQGGGHSPLTPVFGMGVDNVRQVEIITPRRGKIIANECQNSDVFFAVQGGGGGTWGVVTNITYKAIPKHSVVQFNYTVTGLDNDAMKQYYEILTSNALNWAESSWGGYIRSTPGGGGQAVELVNANATVESATRDMSELIGFLNKYGQRQTLTSRSSWFEYFQYNLEAPKNHVGGFSGAVASRLLSTDVFTNQTRTASLTNALWELYKDNVNLWIMLVAPTTFDHTTTSALHPSWKNATWEIRANARWDQFYTPTGIDAKTNFKKVHDKFASIRAFGEHMGVSINEADIWEEKHELVYWGQDNYKKLLEVKKYVDPENLLSNYAAVNWDPTDARYKCYPKKF